MKKTVTKINNDTSMVSKASISIPKPSPSETARRLKKAIENIYESTKPDPYKKIKVMVRKGETPKAPVTGKRPQTKQLMESSSEEFLQKGTYKHKEILL